MNSSAPEIALPLSCDLLCDTFSNPMLYVNVRGKYILFYSILIGVFVQKLDNEVLFSILLQSIILK